MGKRIVTAFGLSVFFAVGLLAVEGIAQAAIDFQPYVDCYRSLVKAQQALDAHADYFWSNSPWARQQDLDSFVLQDLDGDARGDAVALPWVRGLGRLARGGSFIYRDGTVYRCVIPDFIDSTRKQRGGGILDVNILGGKVGLNNPFATDPIHYTAKCFTTATSSIYVDYFRPGLTGQGQAKIAKVASPKGTWESEKVWDQCGQVQSAIRGIHNPQGQALQAIQYQIRRVVGPNMFRDFFDLIERGDYRPKAGFAATEITGALGVCSKVPDEGLRKLVQESKSATAKYASRAMARLR